MNARGAMVDLDGRLRPATEVPAAVDDESFFRGEGLYETLLAVEGHPPFGPEHFARLRASARALGLPRPGNDRDLAGRIYALLEANALAGGRARVMIRLDRRSSMIRCAAVDPRVAADRARGVAAITVAHEEPARARHKLVTRPRLREAARRARLEGAGEALVFDGSGRLLEGATSSVFCVLDGTLLTPPLSTGILPGVTRSTVLRLARESGFEVAEREIRRDGIGRADEVFLTSAIRLLVPVLEIDGVAVGPGHPGPVAGALGRALQALVRARCQRG